MKAIWQRFCSLFRHTHTTQCTQRIGPSALPADENFTTDRFEKYWNSLQEGLQVIQDRLMLINNVKDIKQHRYMSNREYMTYYTMVYDICQSSYSDNRNHKRGELYTRSCTNLIQFANKHINENKALAEWESQFPLEKDESKKQALFRQHELIWTRYNAYAKSIQQIFRHFERDNSVVRYSIRSQSAVEDRAKKSLEILHKDYLQMMQQEHYPKEKYVVMILCGEITMQDLAKEATKYSYMNQYMSVLGSINGMTLDEMSRKRFDYLIIPRIGTRKVKFDEDIMLDGNAFAQYLEEQKVIFST